MSWLQDLAGKAENILTKIDKNAATVLQNPVRPENGDVEALEPLVEVTTSPSPRMDYGGTVATPVAKLPTAESRPSSSRSLRLSAGSRAIAENSPSERRTSSRASSVSSKREGTVIEVGPGEVEVQEFPSVEKELATTKIFLAEIKSERDELKVELDSVQSMLSSAECEASLRELESRYQSLVDERNELYIKLMATEESNAKYIKSISELESIVSKHIQNEQEIGQKLEMAQMETANATAELQQYRIRAHATLQLKEKMIEQLKDATSQDCSEGEKGNSERLMLMELEQLKNDRHSMQEEIAGLNEKYEQGKKFWQTMEQTLRTSAFDLESRVAELQQKLSLESTKALQLQDNLNIKQKELQSAREEVTKQRTSLSVQMHEKESEITKLKAKMQSRPSNSSADLELRLNSLTQSLVQKQTTLESTTAERNALRLQLEKLDTQYRSTVTQIRQQRVPYLSLNETDDAKSQVPNFMVENPFDSRVSRRVKRAYSSLDSIGVRLGVFMRRYPLVRILVIVYVAVLHLWVMFVLLSSTPAAQ
ncbi:golgin-84 [Culex pipiens pallens]|uniref:golgin-84 n=1 Tax=Culex pipiens pallens TaxID=42434 RepID=UPI001952B77D|nr:golgin-84 [Culex pipiens pallens]